MKIYNFLSLLFAICLILTFGATGVIAGGSSDSSGEGYHCYLFFEFDDGTFAQVMANDSKDDEVLKKVDEFIYKYGYEEGGTLVLSVGNIPNSGDCETPPDLTEPPQPPDF